MDKNKIFVFYGDLNEIEEKVNPNIRKNFEALNDGILRTCYFFLKEPRKEKGKEITNLLAQYQKQIPDKENQDPIKIFENLGVLESEDIIELSKGSFKPYDLSKLFEKEGESTASSLFLKKINDDYLVLAQQTVDLSLNDAENVIAAILKTLEKKEVVLTNYLFYLFFHDQHIGRPSQSTPDIPFDDEEKTELMKNVQSILGSTNQLMIKEVISFKHQHNGKIYSILKKINEITNSNEILNMLHIYKIYLCDIIRSFLPTLIDMKTSEMLEKIKLDSDAVKKEFFEGNDENAHLITLWRKKEIDESVEKVLNSLDNIDIDKEEFKSKVYKLKEFSDYKSFYRAFIDLMPYLKR